MLERRRGSVSTRLNREDGVMGRCDSPLVLDLPGVPPLLLEVLVGCAGQRRLAMVGGAVRDLLLHRVHNDPWRGLPDLDLVVEGEAGEAAAVWLTRALERSGRVLVRGSREHGAYGTVEIALELAQPTGSPGRVLLDVATARREVYPVAGGNPQVSFAELDDDLARRDFSINAMALVLADPPRLLDPHGGQADLAQRLLRFLHPGSVRDDPTRLVRAARYAARLDFDLAPSSLEQVRQTLAAWPWPWRPGDPPAQAPAALGTRLRMELQLLLERERWPQALACLQRWEALSLLDPGLQRDRSWQRRLRWGARLGLPPLLVWLAGADHPQALAERLQLPRRQLRWLAALPLLRAGLPPAGSAAAATPWDWTRWLEQPGLPPEAIALALAAGIGPRRPLLRWWLRWRHLAAPQTARELLQAGLAPGPALGDRLRELRAERLRVEPS